METMLKQMEQMLLVARFIMKAPCVSQGTLTITMLVRKVRMVGVALFIMPLVQRLS